ncbi:MAG: TetR family transcriptional regulator [Chloroflexi bacterium]|nr:TetR family transcriptional regulator [Chloroflexota bacterium]
MAKPVLKTVQARRDGAARGPRANRGVLEARIVAAARASFAEQGWAGTTLRGVAREAGVDSALVHYYFGSKEALLEASTALPPAWMASMRTTAARPERRRGEAIVRNVLWVWSQPEIADVWRSIVLTAADQPNMRDKLIGLLSTSLLPAVAAELTGDERLLRASLAAAQMFGLIMMRYVWRIDPLASLPDEDVVALVAPAVQRYLTGRLRRS